MIAISSGWVRATAVGLALLGLGATAQAQTAKPSPAAIAMGRQLIQLKGVDKMFDPALTGMLLRAKNVLLQANPMVSKDLDAVTLQLRGEFQPRLEELKQRTAAIYASHFTENELKEALAFYKSPLGGKLLATEPQVLSEAMAYGDKWANDLGEEVIAKMRAEMRKRGHEL